jgi:hypothetical protein
MPVDPHARAQQLIAEQLVEGIGQADREWLEGHAGECAACAAAVIATEQSLRQLRSIPVELPRDLASRTQMRVYLRAQEMRPVRSWTLWAAFALCWVTGIASAPLVWRGFEWFGHFVGVPGLVLKLAFGLWWGVPAAIAVGIWSLEKRARVEERE